MHECQTHNVLPGKGSQADRSEGVVGSDCQLLDAAVKGATPAPTDAAIAQMASECGFSLDQTNYPFDVIVFVGNHHSPPVSADRFDYLGPTLSTLSPTSMPVGDAPRTLTINGQALDKATQVLYACPGSTHGFYYGPNGFKVNVAGTQISTVTPPQAWTYIATAEARCGGQLDQASYPFDIQVSVGLVHSKIVPPDVFTFDGPTIASMSLNHLKENSTAVFHIHGSNFQSATAVEWDCSAGVYGFQSQLVPSDVSADGTTITAKTSTSAASNIARISKQCGFTSKQTSYKFDVRVIIGALYSPRAGADIFSYTK